MTVISILRKTGKVLIIILISLFALYLFIGLVAVPVGLPWAIRSQGSKILAHPVSVRSAFFNPFTLRLNINGLAIQDNDKQLMLGFKKFWVDVSFVKLLQKQYRVESLGLDGLTVNVVLLPDSKINLLSLAPQPAQGAPQPAGQSAAGTSVEAKASASKGSAAPASAAASASATGAQPLPDAVVDEIILKNGAVTFTDQAIAPGFSTRLSAMDLRVTGVSTKPDCQVKLVFSSRLDEKGRIATEARVKPFVQPLAMEAAFSLNDYALRVLTPYVGKYTGRAVKEGGKLDLHFTYRIADNKLVAGHKVLVQSFDFGEKVASKDALPLPFGLAVALLEDPEGRIDISLPVTGKVDDPQFEYFHLLGQVARNFFMKLITAPFKVLLSIVPSSGPGTEELGSLSFAPGATVLSDADKEKVGLLVKAMQQRPKILLEINGSYDPDVDWKKIKVTAFENEFAAMRKESVRTDFQLVEDIYRFRFGVRAYWALNRKYTQGKKTDEAALKAEMKRQIIEEGAPDKTALNALARARAQAVYDLILKAGLDATRVKIGENRSTQSSMDQVPMEFTLTVFEDKADGNSPEANAQKETDEQPKPEVVVPGTADSRR